MFNEGADPEQQQAAQRKALAAYLRYEVCAYSAAHRRRLEPAPDLSRVPPLKLSDIDDPAALVLHPDAARIAAAGTWEMKGRLAFAQLTRRLTQMERGVIERRYKPVHWIMARNVPVGYSHRDLGLLAEIGRRSLELAGVTVSDTIVSLLAPGPNLAYWQVLLGAQRAGVSIIGLDPRTEAASVAALQPTVLAASAATLERLAGQLDRPLPELSTVVAAGIPGDERVPPLGLLAGGPRAALTALYAPPGVKALWAQCRGGDGLHLWPESEVVDDDGGLLTWSALDWRGTVFVRLATGLRGRVDWSPCPACKRPGPRVVDLAPAAGAVAPVASAVAAPAAGQPDDEVDDEIETVLDGHAGVKVWQAELRTVAGFDELIVYLAAAGGGHPGRMLREIDAALDVTQFVVLDHHDVAERIRAHGGRRVLDWRP